MNTRAEKEIKKLPEGYSGTIEYDVIIKDDDGFTWIFNCGYYPFRAPIVCVQYEGFFPGKENYTRPMELGNLIIDQKGEIKVPLLMKWSPSYQLIDIINSAKPELKVLILEIQSKMRIWEICKELLDLDEDFPIPLKCDEVGLNVFYMVWNNTTCRLDINGVIIQNDSQNYEKNYGDITKAGLLLKDLFILWGDRF